MYFPFKLSLKRAKQRKRLSIILKKFLKFCKFEPCGSYKKNSYKKNCVLQLKFPLLQPSNQTCLVDHFLFSKSFNFLFSKSFKKENTPVFTILTIPNKDETDFVMLTFPTSVQGRGLFIILLGKPLYYITCLLYTSPSPRDKRQSRMPSSA